MSQMIIQIRQQLKQCLKMWEASDDSAIAILKPWKSVWSPAEWDQFMMQNIYSKLETHLNRIIISVESVNGKIIEDIQKWANLVPTISLVKLFNEVFFTKWIAVLKTWLKSSKVKYFY
jgi:tuftelin-interacting protein 11